MNKKTYSLALIILFALCMPLSAFADDGICGDNMRWSLDDSGTLTISGTGEMYDYVDFENNIVTIPWFEKNDASTIKNVVIENGVESISDMAFYGTSITSLKLPKSVRSIGISSIANCKNLIVVSLSENITELPEGTFNSDGNLETVLLPKKLKTIGESAFIHCCKLKYIVIPSSVIDIKDMAFFDCSLLNEIVLPKKTTTIEQGVFESCNNLTRVIFQEGLKTIEQSAFSNCANIEEIILPDGLEKIGKNAFSYKQSDRNSNLPEQRVYVPESVKIIENNGISKNSVIYGFKDSVAQVYATENEIEFVEVSESLYTSDKDNNFINIKSREYPDFDISQYWFAGHNIINGYEDGTFRPDNNITRAEFLKILMDERAISEELSKNTPDGDINFSDVSKTHWAYDAIKTAVNAGIVNGYEDGTFRPDDNITFEQGIKMTLSMLGYAPLAEMYGGYPTGYMAIGYNTRFFKAVESSLDWKNCSVENMDEEKQKSYMTRRDAAAFAERAFLTPICYISGTETNWDGSHSYVASIGGDDIVVKTIYSTSGAATVEK